MIPHAKRLVVLLLLLFASIGCDQATKYKAKELLPRDTTISVAEDTIRLRYIENHGAFLGLGASLSRETRFWIFIVLVSLALTALFFHVVSSRTLKLWPAVALTLVLGGGLSNLIDRLIYKGAVVDFVNIGIGSLRTGIFNMADVAIVAGAGLMVGFAFLESRSSHPSFNQPSE